MPATFSRRTPKCRATRTDSVMISSAILRTNRCWRSAPRRSPPIVPSAEMAALIASLLQRFPARLSVTSTGPNHLEHARYGIESFARGARVMRAKRAKPPWAVRSYTPGSGIAAPHATTAPSVRAPPAMAATRGSHKTVLQTHHDPVVGEVRERAARRARHLPLAEAACRGARHRSGRREYARGRRAPSRLRARHHHHES